MTLFYTQASAGSGKTTSIEKDVTEKLGTGSLKPDEIMAVTFNVDAAAELKGRISQSLLKKGQPLLANGIMSARVGTVHSVFGRLLTDFAFELGLSPEQRVLDDQDKYQVLSEALDKSINLDQIKQLNNLSNRLCIEDWQKDVLSIIELMRSNNLVPERLNDFADNSISTLIAQLPSEDKIITEQTFEASLSSAITKAKQLVKPTVGLGKAIKSCEAILRQPALTWQNWVKVSKLKPTKMGEPAFADAMSLGVSIISIYDGLRVNLNDD